MEPAYRARSLPRQQHSGSNHMYLQHCFRHHHTPPPGQVRLAATNTPKKKDSYRVTVRHRRSVSPFSKAPTQKIWILIDFCSSACIANIMIIYYVIQLGGSDADVSFNAAWMGCWAYVEIALGITVTCSLSMPKLIEARGNKVRAVFANFTRSFTSFGFTRSINSFGSLMRSTRHETLKPESNSRGGTPLDELHSKTDLINASDEHVVEVYPAQDDWRDIPALPKGIQAGPKGSYRNTR